MKMIAIQWLFLGLEGPCNQDKMEMGRDKLVISAEMKIHSLKGEFNQLKRLKINQDLFLRLLNLWRALEVVERKVKIRMRKSQSLRWIPNACLALDNLPVVYCNASN